MFHKNYRVAWITIECIHDTLCADSHIFHGEDGNVLIVRPSDQVIRTWSWSMGRQNTPWPRFWFSGPGHGQGSQNAPIFSPKFNNPSHNMHKILIPEAEANPALIPSKL